MFLRSIHYFRALAIVFIVAGHSYGLGAWWIHTVADKTVANVISGGTSLFVFVSGFLFHHVFFPKFSFGSFMMKKIHYVLLPYLVLSSVFLISILATRTGFNADQFLLAGEGIYALYLRPLALYLWTGGVNFTYWYIPFIMVMFLLSPAFVAFIRARSAVRWAAFAAFLCVSLVLHRPVLNLSVIQSVVYFIPVYLAGILASIHKERIYAVFHRRDGYLLAVVLGLAVLQAVFIAKEGSLHKAPLEFAGLDVSLVQKLVLCLFLMAFLHRFEDMPSRALDTLAEGSFAIFFIHPFIVLGISKTSLPRMFADNLPDLSLLRLAVMTIVVVAASLCVALFVKAILRRYSRIVIGW